jgi:hypothetical protein
LPDEDLNFFEDYSDKKFQQFCHFAISMSEGGSRGSYGGSIVLSHAFAEHKNMRDAYRGRFGTRLVKREIQSLVWKDSELVGQYLRNKEIDFETLFNQNKQIRFLMPLRDPISCANSVVRYGMNRQYKHLPVFDLENVLASVLEEFAWFEQLKSESPERFYNFYQDELDANGVLNLSKFLDLEADDRWVGEVGAIYRLGRDKHQAEELELFRRLAEKHLYKHPHMMGRLKEMTGASGPSGKWK